MDAAYQLTALSQALPGMELSEELLDRQGHVLLPKGAVLTQAMLTSLARHGVSMLPILGSPDPAVADPVAVQARLDHLFRNNMRDNNQDWATGTLRRYVEAYRFARGVRP